MRKRQPAAFDLRAILGAGFDARGESAWHAEAGPDGRHSWHASALSGCIRAQILKRAKVEQDGHRLESLLTFEVGHAYHRLIQEAAEAYAKMAASFEVVGIEIGGHHPTLPLAARADLVYRVDGVPLIVDIKTESSFAAKHRREEATNGSSARAEHCMQLAATAMVVEALDLSPPIEDGWIAYVEKEKGGLDQQPVALDEELRAKVKARLDELDQAWAFYELTGELPDRLPDHRKVWNCRPRGDLNTVEGAKGLYCAYRTACYARPPL